MGNCDRAGTYDLYELGHSMCKCEYDDLLVRMLAFNPMVASSTKTCDYFSDCNHLYNQSITTLPLIGVTMDHLGCAISLMCLSFCTHKYKWVGVTARVVLESATPTSTMIFTQEYKLVSTWEHNSKMQNENSELKDNI